MNPYIIEATASVTSQVLIFAEDFEQAVEASEQRRHELADAITKRAGLDLDDPAVLFGVEVRPAMGFECIGSEALTPGAVSFDECDDPDHGHGGPL